MKNEQYGKLLYTHVLTRFAQRHKHLHLLIYYVDLSTVFFAL